MDLDETVLESGFAPIGHIHEWGAQKRRISPSAGTTSRRSNSSEDQPVIREVGKAKRFHRRLVANVIRSESEVSNRDSKSMDNPNSAESRSGYNSPSERDAHRNGATGNFEGRPAVQARAIKMKLTAQRLKKKKKKKGKYQVSISDLSSIGSAESSPDIVSGSSKTVSEGDSSSEGSSSTGSSVSASGSAESGSSSDSGSESDSNSSDDSGSDSSSDDGSGSSRDSSDDGSGSSHASVNSNDGGSSGSTSNDSDSSGSSSDSDSGSDSGSSGSGSISSGTDDSRSGSDSDSSSYSYDDGDRNGGSIRGNWRDEGSSSDMSETEQVFQRFPSSSSLAGRSKMPMIDLSTPFMRCQYCSRLWMAGTGKHVCTGVAPARFRLTKPKKKDSEPDSSKLV